MNRKLDVLKIPIVCPLVLTEEERVAAVLAVLDLTDDLSSTNEGKSNFTNLVLNEGTHPHLLLTLKKVGVRFVKPEFFGSFSILFLSRFVNRFTSTGLISGTS